MHGLINALVLAFTMPGQTGTTAGDSPICRADMLGDVLTTQVEFADGFIVEGPWRIITKSTVTAGEGGQIVAAILERFVEIDPVTDQTRISHFREGVALTFRGRTQEELVAQAAQIWCSTVLRSQKNGGVNFAPRTIRPIPIARLEPARTGGPAPRALDG
jgi:hypothetical protein